LHLEFTGITPCGLGIDDGACNAEILNFRQVLHDASCGVNATAKTIKQLNIYQIIPERFHYEEI
jgi:hypothetical protein